MRAATFPARRGSRGAAAAAAALFAAIFGLRFVVGNAEDGLTFLYVVPVALVAVEFGRRAGVAAGAAAFGLYVVWELAVQTDITVLGQLVRAGVFLIAGAFIGHTADRIRLASVAARTLIEAAPDAIVQVGPDGRIALANRQVEALFGYTAEELLGQTIDVLVPQRLRHAHAGHRARYDAAPRTRSMGKNLELSGLRKDGTELPIEISLSPHATDAGTMVTAIIRDVSDRRRVERQLRAGARYFEVARDLLCTVGADGRLLHLNGSWEAALGCGLDELTSRPLDELVHPDDRELAARSLAGLAYGGGDADFSIRIATKDGRWRWIDWVASGDPGSGVVYASARDVSERRRIESELGLHSEIVSTMAEGVVLIGAVDRRVVYANPRFEEIFGYDCGGLEGKAMSALVAAEPEADEAARRIARAVERGAVWSGELPGVKADGTAFWCSAHVSQFDDSERGRLWVAVLADVTERKGIEEDRERAARELMRSNAELEQFAYSASHDLSEPLRVIEGFARLLSRRYGGRLDEDADHFLDAIQSGVESMQALIDALLAYSRVGRGAPRLTRVGAADVAAQALEGLATLVEERGASVELGELPVVEAEPSLLRQLFQNLVSNAIKFTDGPAPGVEVSARREGPVWRFSVADGGSGIAPADAERVFEMFQRLHGRDVPGTGIGLAICKRIVERHGGEISVAPRPGGGSVFSFTIPASPAGGEGPATDTRTGPRGERALAARGAA